MKIYIAHSRSFDYEQELYLPIRQLQSLQQEDIILPHELDHSSNNTREFYQNLDLVIAEASFPATGMGIELGWAYDSKVPIACIYRHDVKVSGSLHAVTDEFYEYSTPEEMVAIIEKIIARHL